MKKANTNRAKKSQTQKVSNVKRNRAPHSQLKSQGASVKSKLRITIALDTDVVKEFQRRAAAPGALPYQTQMNAALRGYIFGENQLPAPASLVNDEEFIEEVARRVRELTAKE